MLEKQQFQVGRRIAISELALATVLSRATLSKLCWLAVQTERVCKILCKRTIHPGHEPHSP